MFRFIFVAVVSLLLWSGYGYAEWDSCEQFRNAAVEQLTADMKQRGLNVKVYKTVADLTPRFKELSVWASTPGLYRHRAELSSTIAQLSTEGLIFARKRYGTDHVGDLFKEVYSSDFAALVDELRFRAKLAREGRVGIDKYWLQHSSGKEKERLLKSIKAAEALYSRRLAVILKIEEDEQVMTLVQRVVELKRQATKSESWEREWRVLQRAVNTRKGDEVLLLCRARVRFPSRDIAVFLYTIRDLDGEVLSSYKLDG